MAPRPTLLRRLGSAVRKRKALPSALILVACGSPGAKDAGFDAGRDAGEDAGFDAGVDAGADAGSDAGTDSGMPDSGVDGGLPDSGCPHPPTTDDAGVRCDCEVTYLPDGDAGWFECCDTDVGNPCPICCYNPRDADGGRMYYADGGPPVCYC